MKLSELIEQAQKAMAEHGDIDVCVPYEGDDCDGWVCDSGVEVLVRVAGYSRIPQDKWEKEDFRTVFVIG